MKQLILLAVLLGMTASTFSQQTPPKPALSEKDYLTKSKHQRTAGMIMLGGGVALMGTGIVVANSGNRTLDKGNTGAGLILVGLVSSLGSIPLFIASSHNKKNAFKAGAWLEMRAAPALAGPALGSQAYPAVSLKIRF